MSGADASTFNKLQPNSRSKAVCEAARPLRPSCNLLSTGYSSRIRLGVHALYIKTLLESLYLLKKALQNLLRSFKDLSIHRTDRQQQRLCFILCSDDELPFRPSDSEEEKNVIYRPGFDPYNLYYDMSGSKYLLIFNHYKFQDTHYFRHTPANREGTDKDVATLTKVFEDRRFKVTPHDDLTYDEMKATVENFIAHDHGSTSCICVAILSHGDKNGHIYAADKPYSLQKFMSQFENPKLATIPRLFFIQACRGGEIDKGNFVSTDSQANKKYHVPSQIDFLTLYPTVEGLVSFRDDGSWMIQAICYVISKYYEHFDILQLITLANNYVAFGRCSNNPDNEEIHNKKQTLEATFTLTKLLKFE
ncbi:caspase-like [Achroia grisella]|uniref:caspase-like n=1 Tax=Achroia grisella TaxID=688607 RepID=UPI0027D30982|nr:caspase-like [Achroia grisella]